jgi:hypothetical protein
MTKHSVIVGGSTAGRLLACPGSFQATQALPPSTDAPSAFAEEGTAMHAVMDHLMRTRQDFFNDTQRRNYDGAVQAMVGKKTFHDRILTQAHVDDMILPAMAALTELEDLYGGGFRVAAVEMRVRFPGVPGAFGTADLLLVSDTHAIVCDWKFGQGVPVSALYVDDDNGDLLNPQLMYYLAGAINSAHRLFVRRKLVIAVIQPRTSEPLTHTEVTRKDVKFFREDLERAVQAAVDRNPPLAKGEHCRWCPAKIACPLWTTPILGLAEAIGETVAKPPAVAGAQFAPESYGQYLAKAKAFVDLLAMYQKEVNDQLHSYLEAGGQVPGWRLKAKAKMRQWIDENVVDEELRKLGFNENEIWQDKLQTFQVAERAAKRLGVSIPDHLRVAPESTETTIAPTNDPAPVVDRTLAQAEFTAALRKLT